ncbi:MAG: hypothetical protein CMI90_00785 [Pelagibacteraceae bacterium]|nr:hypothetical protein [Pelagibacteraceae bacterium]
MNYLIKLFKAKSFFHLIIIFFVFGISGSLSLFLSGPLLIYLNLQNIIKFYPLYIILKLIIIFPIYQIVLIIVAIVFGQFSYFIEIEKKIFRRLKIF